MRPRRRSLSCPGGGHIRHESVATIPGDAESTHPVGKRDQINLRQASLRPERSNLSAKLGRFDAPTEDPVQRRRLCSPREKAEHGTAH